MQDQRAKNAIDSLIKKTRVHFYKPIQIAEILYRHRVENDIDLLELETYRNASKKWRDEICVRFLGRISTSSARYQDDLFNQNAISPETLSQLGGINNSNNGIVEAYIYRRFIERMSQMATSVAYCNQHDRNSFSLQRFLELFGQYPGCGAALIKSTKSSFIRFSPRWSMLSV